MVLQSRAWRTLIVKQLEAERDRIDAAISALRGLGQTSSGSQPSIAALFFQAIGWVRYRVGILLFRFALKSSDAFVYPSELPFLRPPVRDPSREWQNGGRRVPARAQGDRYAYP